MTVGDFDDDDGGGGDWEWENDSASNTAAPAAATTNTASPAQPTLPPVAVTPAARVESMVMAALKEEAEVEEEEAAVEEVEEEYEMDHEQPLTPAPAILSPGSSAPTYTSVASLLQEKYSMSSYTSALEEKTEEEQHVAVKLEAAAEEEYEPDVEQQHDVATVDQRSAVSWPAHVAAHTAVDEATAEEEGSQQQQQPLSASERLPPAASLSPNATTCDFSVHKHHRSISINSNDRIDQSLIDEQPALSPQASFVVQSSSHNTLPGSPSLSSASSSASPLAPASTAVFDTEARLFGMGGMSGMIAVEDDGGGWLVEEKRMLAMNDSKYDSLSVSAIALTAADEDMDDVPSISHSALSSIDADFCDTAASVSSSATAIDISSTRSTRLSAAVIVEDEDENEAAARAGLRHAVRSSHLVSHSVYHAPASAASTADTRITSQAPTQHTRTPERPLQRSPVHAQPPALPIKQARDAATSTDDPRYTPSHHTANGPLVSQRHAVSPTRQPHTAPAQAIRPRPITSRPAVAVSRSAIRNVPSAHQPAAAGFPFSSPSHVHSSQYAPPLTMSRAPRFVPPSMPPPSQKMRPAQQPVPPPSAPAPVAPSAPYVASKQALLQMLARHQHHRASRRQHQHQTHVASNPSAPSACVSSHNTFDHSELHQWQQQRHGDDRLARMLKAWQLSGQSKQRSVVGMRLEQQEAVEDAEMEWLARKEEERRQEERRWQRSSSAHRPATPGAPLKAVPAWQNDDALSETGSSGGSEVWKHRSEPPSMVELMEGLRASARDEIASLEAARHGLR